MRAVLIWPGLDNIVSADYMKKIQKGVGFLPPLGLLSVATFANEKNRHQVFVLDANLEGLSINDIIRKITELNPKVVGISCLTHTLLNCTKLAQAVKQQFPNIIVVLGGPHLSLYYKEALDNPNVDYIIRGEGEVPFANLLDLLEDNPQSLPETDNILGLMKKDDPEKAPYITPDLNLLPIGDRSLTPFERYSSVVSVNPPTTVIMSSRGCPYPCGFCYTAGGKKFRAMCPERIVLEMEQCVKLGIKEFMFFDELFTFDRDRVMEFCKLLQKSHLKVNWDVRARVDKVDKEMLKTMAQAGLRRIQYGIESGNNRVLKVLRKGFTVKTAEDAIKWTKEANILTYADFMIGAPTETEENIAETVKFAKSLSLDYLHFSVLMLYPETEFYKEALRVGLLKKDLWAEFAKNPTPDFKPPYWTKELSEKRLNVLIDNIMRDIYFSPSFILRRLKALKNPGEFMRLAKAAIKLIKK